MLGGKGRDFSNCICLLQAIIKYLQDHGVLILLTSSALAQDDGNAWRQRNQCLGLNDLPWFGDREWTPSV